MIYKNHDFKTQIDWLNPTFSQFFPQEINGNWVNKSIYLTCLIKWVNIFCIKILNLNLTQLIKRVCRVNPIN